MKCSDIEELLCAYANEELSRTQREFVEEHLANCADCRAKLVDYTLVRQQLSSLRAIPTMSDIKGPTMIKIKEEHGRTPSQKWLRPALAAIPVIAILIVLTVLQPWSSFQGTQTIMAKAYAATASLQSYRATIIGTASEGRTLDSIMEFVSPDRFHARITSDGVTDEFTIIGDKQYVKSGDMSRNMIIAFAKSASSILSKETTMQILDSLTDLQKLPDAKIEGVDSYHYKGRFDAEKMIKKEKARLSQMQSSMSPEDYQEMLKGLENSLVVKMEIELWIGKDDNLVRQMIQVTQAPDSEGKLHTSSTTLKYYDFNQPINIEPPVDTQGNLLPDWRLAGSITSDSTQPVFSKNIMVTIGAEPAYNDAAHQQITFRITITNQSSEIVKNVRIILSTMATNEVQKPQVIQAEPQTAGWLDFKPNQSETYIATWKYDGNTTSKQEISRMVDETTVAVKFTTQDGRELTQSLSSDAPHPTVTPR